MKNVMLLMLLLFGSNLIAQLPDKPNDTQWYVWGDKMRADEATSLPSALKVKYVQRTVNHQFYIKGIDEPCFKCNPEEIHDDDILAIFSNGSFYNSRFDTRRDDPDYGGEANASFKGKIWEYGTNGQDIISEDIQLNLAFDKSSTIQLNYLYWTNKYDEDDPPPIIAVDGKSNSVPDNNIATDKHFIHRISANHDVVKGKDITIILDNRDGFFNLGFNLDFGAININGFNTSQLKFFENSPVFKSNSQWILGADNDQLTVTSINNQMRIERKDLNLHFGKFIFINLEPTDDIDIILKQKGNADPVLTFKVYALGSDVDNTVFSWPEKVRLAHDPNFLKAKSICNTQNGYYIYYQGQYQNDGTKSTLFSEIDIKLPGPLISSEIKLYNIIYGGLPLQNSINIGNFQRFHTNYFDQELVSCKDKDAISYANSIVKFDMCIGPINDPDFPSNYKKYLVNYAEVKFEYDKLEMNRYDEIKKIDCATPRDSSTRHVEKSMFQKSIQKNNECYQVDADCNVCQQKFKIGKPVPIEYIDLEILKQHFTERKFKGIMKKGKLKKAQYQEFIKAFNGG